MRKLIVRLRQSPNKILTVGELAEVDHQIFFEYDPSFLDGRLELSPYRLPARRGLIEHQDLAFGPLPGVFDDSLPDGWGLLLMDRIFRKRGIDPAIVSPLERLSYLGQRTMGALTYEPAEDVESDDRLIDLFKTGRNAQVIHGGGEDDILPELARAGGSAGGARPKLLIGVKGKTIISGEDDLPPKFEHWIVKFSAKTETRDAGRIEYAYSKMAAAAQVSMPPTRLFLAGRSQAYFGARRFDRQPGNARLHMHTFANLIQTNFRIPSTDYSDLLKVISGLTRRHADVLRAFRQMVFNIAAHNRDDHAKNFAFLMDARGRWTLSPAYDLVPSPGPGGEHTMPVAGEGSNPGREHVLAIAAQFGVARNNAMHIIEQVNDAIRKWARFADEAAVTKKSVKSIGGLLRPI